MNIGSVNNEQVQNTQANLKKIRPKKAFNAEEETVKSGTIADKLELSDEAKGLQPIQARVQAGDYNDPAIMKYVAQRLSYELPPENNEA